MRALLLPLWLVAIVVLVLSPWGVLVGVALTVVQGKMAVLVWSLMLGGSAAAFLDATLPPVRDEDAGDLFDTPNRIE